MSECPNCGFRSYHPAHRCGCTWDEKSKAADIKERDRRKRLAKSGRPVIVDRFSRKATP